MIQQNMRNNTQNNTQKFGLMGGILFLSAAMFSIGLSCSGGEKASNHTPARESAGTQKSSGISGSDLFTKAKKMYDARDFKGCAPFMKKAAEMGHAGAQMHMGKMRFNGWGIPHDHALARKWHEKAAAQGNKESIKKLKDLKH